MARKLKNWITAYMEYTQHSESPDEFHKWTAIGTIAGALRRRVWFDMGYFTWYPNFFLFFVAPPGVVSKSTTVSLGIDLLRQVDGIKFGPSVVTWQELVRRLEDAQEDFLYKDEFYPMASLTIAASELGTFLDPRNREMVDVLVDLWDGKKGAWEKATKTGSSENIQNPWIHILGCTTPSWIAENFGDYFFGGGLASRSVMVYAENKRKLVAYPKLHFKDDMKMIKNALIKDLEKISNLAGPYEATKEAYKWGTDWYEEHWFGEHKNLEAEKFQAYLARKQTHIHKTAMVLAAAESDERVIGIEHLKQAYDEITSLEKNMPQVYGKMNRETEMIMAADVMSFIRANGKCNKTFLYREFYRIMSYQTFSNILESLRNTGLVGAKSDGSGLTLYPVDEKKLKEKEKKDGTNSTSI